MDDSALYPPNRQALSDAVIAGVMQRVKPSSYVPSPASSGASALLCLQKSPSPFPNVYLAVTKGQCRLPSLSVLKPQRSAVSTDASDEIEFRRQRNRMHQARHKMKQIKVEDLETSIRQLREEVQELKLQREVLTVGIMSNTTVWNVAAEYFRMFRHGVRASSFQMVPSVVSETGYGVDALMENWSFVSKFHPDIDVQLMCSENDAEGWMVGKTLGRLTITENTLRHAFPHLIDDGEGGERTQLAERILGQQLVMRGAVHFEWDHESGRIARVQHKADLLTPLLELLGSLEAVSCVFDNALVTPESTSVAWGEFP